MGILRMLAEKHGRNLLVLTGPALTGCDAYTGEEAIARSHDHINPMSGNHFVNTFSSAPLLAYLEVSLGFVT